MWSTGSSAPKVQRMPADGEREAAEQRQRTHDERQPGQHREEQVRPGPGDVLHPRRVGEVGSQEPREGEQPDVLGQDATGGVRHRGARDAGEPLRLERNAPRKAPRPGGRGRARAGAPRRWPPRAAARAATSRRRAPARPRCPPRPGRPPPRCRRGAGRPPLPRWPGWPPRPAPPRRPAVPGSGPPRAPRRPPAWRPGRGWSRAVPCARRWGDGLDVGGVHREEQAGHQRHPGRPVGHGRLGEPPRQRQHQQ